MGWDVYIMDFSEVPIRGDVPDWDQLPKDWQPGPVGPKKDLIAKILEILPTTNFSDPTWGQYAGEGFSVEFNVGSEDPIESIMLHVRGGEAAVDCVNRLIKHLEVRALDTTTGKLIDPDGHTDGMRLWREFRDQILSSKE